MWRGSTHRLRSVLRGVGLVVVVTLAALLLPVEAWAATPAPYPPTGGAASAWSCRDHFTPSPSPTTTDVLVSASPSPSPTSVDVPVRDGDDCTVSSWAADPAASPVGSVALSCPAGLSTSPSASASPTPSASPSTSSGSPSSPCTVSLDAGQYQLPVFLLGALLMLAIATFVATYARKLRKIGGS